MDENPVAAASAAAAVAAALAASKGLRGGTPLRAGAAAPAEDARRAPRQDAPTGQEFRLVPRGRAAALAAAARGSITPSKLRRSGAHMIGPAR